MSTASLWVDGVLFAGRRTCRYRRATVILAMAVAARAAAMDEYIKNKNK